ncbi:MAG: putative ABC transporter permease subunit [Thermodesulfobacteriota bacterium]
MRDILALMRPRVLTFKNATRRQSPFRRLQRIGLFGAVGALFWSGMLWIVMRVLTYFQGTEEIGNLLSWKLLSMVMVIYFSLLIFSSLLTHLSKLYLSRDLQLVHALPVAGRKIFLARWMESTIDSAWMIVLYTLPVLIAYGIVYSADASYYPLMALVLVLLSAAASVISAVVVMVAVIVIPAGRIKTIFVFLGLMLFVILYLAFRLLRPERLVDPEAFETVLLYIQTLKTPSHPLLPSTWAFDALKAALFSGSGDLLVNLGLLASGCATLVLFAVALADAIYFKGMSKTQTARKPLRRQNKAHKPFLPFLPRRVSAYAAKEFKTFFRDQTQWSQIFLILALIFIYIYNFKVLPLERAPIQTVYLQNLLSFLNMGLAAFVLIAVTGRFAYPAVSIEGEAFWLVRAGPISIRTFLWIKFWFYLLPLLVLAQLLIVVTNLLLQVTPFMMGLSTATMLAVVPAVVAMGIGMGAAYPDFNSENPAQAVTSFGGLMFMMIGAAYVGAVIVLEAGPVYRIFMAEIDNRALHAAEWAWIGFTFAVVLALSAAAIVFPMRYGIRRLTDTA